MGERRSLVVGVSAESSLGWAIARALAERGDAVTITCRPARIDAVRALAAPHGIAVTALDVDDPEAIGSVVGGLGRLDALVHTVMHVPAGLLAGPFVDVPRQAFADVVTRPSASLVALCGAAGFAHSPSPRVVTLSSALAVRTGPRYHVAGVAKAALEATARYLAVELGPAGVLVNVLRCGLVDTAGARAAIGEPAVTATAAHLAKRSPTRQAPQAEQVAAAATWLTSAECQNLTGQVLDVDGGFAGALF